MCGVYRTYGTGNNGVCNISSNSNSNSNSNAEVPVPRFTNCFKQVPQHPRDRLAQKTKKDENVAFVKQVQQHPRNRLKRKIKKYLAVENDKTHIVTSKTMAANNN